MRITKKLLALLMCLTMMLQLCVPAFAAGNTNLYAETDVTEAEIGDEITLDIYISDMTASGVKAGFYFDNTKLEITDMTFDVIMWQNPTTGKFNKKASTVSETEIEQANETGSALGVYAINSGRDTPCKEGLLVTVTFVAIANGEAKITLREETVGTNAFKSDEIEGVTITIGGSEPEPPAHTCTPAPVAGQAASCETDGWKDYYQCSDATCGKLYTDAAGKDEITDLAAWKAGAGKIPAGHSYGELIDATPEVHTQTELKGAVAAHFYCPVCKTYFTEDKAATTLDGLTGETPAHADVDPKDHKCDVCGLEMNQDLHKDSATDGDHVCDYGCGEVLEVCSDKDNDGDHDCDVCGKEMPSFQHIGGTAYCNAQPVCSDCGQPYGQTNPENHASEKVTYKNVTDTTHDVYYACCDTLKTSAEGHTYIDGKCACEKVQTFTITWSIDGEEKTDTVEYGTVPTAPEATKADDANFTYTFKAWDKEIVAATKDETYTAQFYRTGWDGKKYMVKDEVQMTGWTEIDGSWYYLDPETGVRAEGLKRVPYPAASTGLSYAPNAEDVAIWEADADSKYTDAETAVFFFGDDGKFQQKFTGLVDGGKRYAKDGMVGWHPGLVEVGGEYYYFIGDKNGGGNIAAEGDIYVTRHNGSDDFEQNGVYNFKNGKLSGLNGIVDGKYYEDSRLMIGLGMTKVGEGYVYVRSNGEIAVGQYWVTTHNDLCESGMYTFGPDGFLQSAKDPNVNGLVDGVYYKNGMPYYAGLIEIDGDMYYIRSNGQMATGTYYVTKVNDTDIAKGTKLVFGDDGKLITAK